MRFLDRQEELGRLRHLFDSTSGAFGCLYGRRRIGKSRLLRECLAGRPSAVIYIADRSSAVLQRARMSADMSRLVPGFGDVVYPDWGALFDRWRLQAPRGAALVIDEFPYLVEVSRELPSVLQRHVDMLSENGQKVLICGSSQRMMQGFVLDAREPLYGRAREIMRLAPLGFPWLKEAFPALTPMACLEHYAVWGGVPRYWELSEGEASLEETLRRQLFSPLGVLRNEADALLLDDLAGSVQASSILSLAGQGVHRLSEMAARLQVPATAMPLPLKRLVELGLLEKQIPFGCNPKDNKRSLYRVTDPFLAFWYRFVLPHYSDEYFLSSASDVMLFRSHFRQYLGFVWEQVVRETLLRCPLPHEEERWGEARRWWGVGTDGRPMEIDVMAASPDGSRLLVGEVKLTMEAAEVEGRLAELKAKAARLPQAGRGAEIVPCLFVAENAPAGTVPLTWALEKLGGGRQQ